MSKVKDYYGTKRKAIHRMKRYETRMKRRERIQKAKNNEYDIFFGYYCYIPEGKDYYRVERNSKNASWLKHQASKQLRRHNNFDEDAVYVLNGALYKRDYDIAWELT